MDKKPEDKKDEPSKITPVPDKLRDDPKGRQDHFNKRHGTGKKPDDKLKDDPKKRLEDFQKRRGLDKNPPKP